MIEVILTSEERFVICKALQKELPQLEEDVKWAESLNDEEDKEDLVRITSWQVEAAKSALEKILIKIKEEEVSQ